MTRLTTMALVSAVIVFDAGCHTGRQQVATAATSQRTAEECANVVAPAPRDPMYKQVLRPMVVMPPANGRGGSSDYIISLAVRVNRAGQVDSVVVLNSQNGVGEMLARRLLAGGTAKAARYQGCPVTAWTNVSVPG